MNGNVLIVTGSTGIGAAAVRLAAAQGARLLVATPDELSGFELAAETGAECWAGDLRAPAAADSSLARYGRLDDDGWENALAWNLGAAFRLCRAAVGSVLAESPDVKQLATHGYAAAKGALAALCRSMAAYYAPHGIRVNVVAPGVAGTPAGQHAQSDPELGEFIRRRQPLTAGVIPVDDIARAALFLLAPEARAVTGEVLTIDAGWRFSGV